MNRIDRSPVAAFTLAALLATAAWGAMSTNLESFATMQRSETYRSAQAALDDGQWRRAGELFDSIADEGGPDADAALYWAAYALHKQGRTREATERIDRLREAYPSSGWAEDAQALAVEIGSTDPTDIADEELKVFALNSLMNADPERAVPVLEEFLGGSSSLKLKKKALFVLSQSHSARAREILGDIASGGSHPDLRREAVQYLGISGDSESRAVLETIYAETTDAEVKDMVLGSFMVSGDRARLLEAARQETSPALRRKAIALLGSLGAGRELSELYRTETEPDIRKSILEGLMIGGEKQVVFDIATTDPDPEMRRAAIEYLGVMGAGEHLRRLYSDEAAPELRAQILKAYMISGDVEALEKAARGEMDPGLRRRAIEYLGVNGGDRAAAILADLYGSAPGTQEKHQIIEALFIQSSADRLITIIESESDPDLRRFALERLSLIGSDEAVDYLIDALKEPSDG